MQLKSLQLPKIRHMWQYILESTYNFNILIHLYIFMQYNCIDTTLYATTMNILDGSHVLWDMILGDNMCHFPFYSKFNITNDIK
jgi:hypothetical protein